MDAANALAAAAMAGSSTDESCSSPEPEPDDEEAGLGLGNPGCSSSPAASWSNPFQMEMAKRLSALETTPALRAVKLEDDDDDDDDVSDGPSPAGGSDQKEHLCSSGSASASASAYVRQPMEEVTHKSGGAKASRLGCGTLCLGALLLLAVCGFVAFGVLEALNILHLESYFAPSKPPAAAG